MLDFVVMWLAVYICLALWSCDWQSDIMLGFVFCGHVTGSHIYMLGFVVMWLAV